MLLLAQATSVDFMATLKVVGIVMLWIIASASSIEKIYYWFTGGSKRKEDSAVKRFEALETAIGQFVDKDALEKRFSANEEKTSKQGLELANQHNTLMEYLRERERLAGQIQARLNVLEEKAHVLEVIPSRVDKMESKLDNLNNQMSDLKNGQRDLRNELREDMKSNKGEILAAIKSTRG